MAVVLVGARVALLGRFEHQLNRTIEKDLRLRARDVAALITESRRAGDPLAIDRSAGRLVQVLDRRNRVVAASSELNERSVLTAGELAAAAKHDVLLERGPDGGVLLLARAAGPRTVVVVGTSLEPRAEARQAFDRVVLVAGPAVLVVAALGGYGVAFFALRPVEAMRRRAAEVTATATAQRLPVPPARDELAALADTLNAMIARLGSALDRERTLVADASHELRTPLAIAQAEVELALRPGTPAPELVAALRSVGEEIERLVRLCDDLLVLTSADRDELRLERRRILVSELLEAVGERARRRHGDRIVVTLDVAGADVHADPLRIEQALSNLVANSFRYGASRVWIWCSAEAGGIRLHASDDGPGFPEEFLPRAFSRFARGPAAPAGSGAGLGLAIVAAIARAHGGEARACNLPEGGADVSILLPPGDRWHEAMPAADAVPRVRAS